MRFFRSAFMASLMVTAGLVLSGCGGSGGSGGGSASAPVSESPMNVTVSGYVVNGPLENALVRVYRGEMLLGETRTDAEGFYRLVVSGTPPLRIVTEGGLLEGRPYAGQLAADCGDPEHCDVTPWTTVIVRLADEHGLDTGDAQTLIAGRIGSTDDPFLAVLPDHAPVTGFDLDAARRFIDGGARLGDWVDEVAQWANQLTQTPPAGLEEVVPGDGGDGSGDGGDGGGGAGDRPLYRVTASAGMGGDITPDSRSVSQGATASFTLSIEAGYEIDSVTGCGGTLSGLVYVTAPVTADCAVVARFRLVAPANLQAEEQEEAVTLSWAPVPGAEAYDLYYATDPDFDPATYAAYENGTLLMSVGPGPLTLEGLTGGVTYYFAVGARGAGTRGAISPVIAATPKKICSGNGSRDEDGQCVCNSQLFTGSLCQVKLQFEGRFPGGWAPFEEPSIQYLFEITTLPQIIYGPILPPGDRYTFTVEVVNNGFIVNQPGPRIGAAVPKNWGVGRLGEFPLQWAFSAAMNMLLDQGQVKLPTGSVQRAVGHRVRVTVDRRGDISGIIFEQKAPGWADYQFVEILAFPSSLLEGEDLRVAVGGTATGIAAVRFVE